VKLRALAIERAADESNPLNNVSELDLQDALQRMWRKRWAEARRRKRDVQDRPEVVKKRQVATLALMRKKRYAVLHLSNDSLLCIVVHVVTLFYNRASTQWVQGLDKAKKSKPEFFTEETYARAKISCLPANMPDFVRNLGQDGDSPGTFVVLQQPWLTQEALGYQKLGRDNRDIFKETVRYEDKEGESGSSKPRNDTPPWLVDQDWLDLNKDEEEKNQEVEDADEA
jgi:hypothetical protein